MRAEITDEKDCPVAVDKPSCAGCPSEFDSREVHEYCDEIVYCRTAKDNVYARAAFQFNTAGRRPDPCVIVMANNSDCLKAVIKYVANHTKLKMAIRGGRHSYIGASTASKGVVLDISRFKYMKQHDENGTMTVGAGLTLSDLYNRLWKEGLLYPGGTCPTVGLAGLTLGGGQGVTGRTHGLSTDQVVEMKMINAAGDEMVINSEAHQDLFWALRGGGNGNYGVVYEFVLKRYEIPNTSIDYLIYFYHQNEWHQVISQWQELIVNESFVDDHDSWSQLTITPASLHVAFHISGRDKPHYIEYLTNGTTPSGYNREDPYIHCTYTPENYSGSIAFWAGCTTDNQCGTTDDLNKCLQYPTDCGGRAFRMHSGFQSWTLSSEGIETILYYMLEVHPRPCLNASLQLDTLGGKINEIQPNSTAFPHRDSTFTYQFMSYYDYGCDESQMKEWLKNFYHNMTEHMSNGSYRNYANPDLTNYNQRYFMENYEKLIGIKKKHDPNNVFKYSQSIPTFVQEIESAILLYWPYAIFIAAVLILVWALYHHCYNSKHHQKQT